MLPEYIDPNSLEIPFQTVSSAIEHYAKKHPLKIAIHSIDQEVSINFVQLANLIDRTAALMIQRGVTPGDRVAILSGECIEKLVLMLASWRCGASACPFHSEIPQNQLEKIIQTINPAIAIWRTSDFIGEKFTTDLPCPFFHFFSMKEDDGFFGNLPEEISCLPPSGGEYGPEDEGCIFATSGTTDMPKCVVWDHLGLWLCGLSTIDFTKMTGNDRLLEYRTFSWLSPQIITFMPFLSLGLTIIIANGFSRRRFISWIRDYKITVVAGVPTVINILLDEPVKFTRKDISSLRLMTASSAPLAPEKWEQFEEYYGIKLLQFYGASEGGWLCGNRLNNSRIGTVGQPAKYMDLAILDQDGKVCPHGKVGEISIRGPQTAMANISSEGKWEDRIPFRLNHRALVGDLGFMDADKFLTVTGRVKDVILRGGVSISPAEIDVVMMQHPKVHEAAVVGVPDKIWGEEITCFVVPAEGSDLTKEELLLHANESLPEGKRPKSILVVEALVKNDRGKVKRDALKNLWLKAPI